jgi:hypothetical protein
MKTHQMTGTPTYWSWVAMRVRCNYPKSERYPNYGGRGIRVCERWSKFENFLADMGQRPNGKTIERRDGNGNYEPSNCVWASTDEQNRNKRSTVNVTIDGETLCLKDWCRRFGLKYITVVMRIRRGATHLQALEWSSR